jgi:hypothetical protein
MPTSVPTSHSPAHRLPTQSMADQLRLRLDRMHGRDRLDAEFTRLAVDVLGPYGSDDLPAADSAWMHERVSHAVKVALDPALAAFMAELAKGLVEAPDDLLARVTRAKLRRELGGE